MLDFKLFNIPVRVQPIFWLGAFVIGGGFHINGRDGMIATLAAMIAIFLSILIHELGHALTSQKLTKVTPSIQLVAFGGLASPNTHLTPKESFRVTWAGPLAGFGLFIISVIALMLKFGTDEGLHFASFITFPGVESKLSDFLIFSKLNLFSISFITTLLWANFWWSVLNLLPVFPLDGGQIYASMEESQIKVMKVGLITGVLAALVFLYLRRPIGAMLFGYLAYQNYQRLQQISGGNGFR